MALYPDPPGPQIIFDKMAGFYNIGSLRSLTLTELQNIISHTDNVPFTNLTPSQTAIMGIIFPELHDVVGSYTTSGRGYAGQMETSVNTTNGSDGTWVSKYNPFTSQANFRSNILSVTWTGIIAARWTINNDAFGGKGLWGIHHLYGSPSSSSLTANPDRLRLWHPSSDVVLPGAALNFGDIGRTSVNTLQFRVKNNSSTMTANSIVVSAAAIGDASPTVVSVLAFDNAGSGYASSQNIGNLAAGTISGVQTVRISPSSTAALGLWRQRIQAIAGSWT